ncbi:hypothetical protein TREES_T100003192 [Tupaia chinensis]|uniref:Uncharacterized protein n=1 Tax=Tupaia chinensis TaxID=246437 RepID=L9KG06_TUPCH|nr:hypothetical protein TREES_T100003192 [Tupaia chinensis]
MLVRTGKQQPRGQGLARQIPQPSRAEPTLLPGPMLGVIVTILASSPPYDFAGKILPNLPFGLNEKYNLLFQCTAWDAMAHDGPACSVTVVTEARHHIAFYPSHSLWKKLRLIRTYSSAQGSDITVSSPCP